MNSKRHTRFIALLLASLIILLFLLINSNKNVNKMQKIAIYTETAQEEWLDFEGFDNVNGTNHYIVPDCVHLLFLQAPYIKFYQLINIFSIHLNHKPSTIYFHCDNCSFYGKYYDLLRNHKDLWSTISIKKIPFKKTIFNKTYGWVNHHRSDTWRLLILMNYGGIYFDNDVYVVQPLHKYRKYELVLSWDSDKDGIGVQVMIAHRNARFLKAHYDSYRYNYTPSEWYWNAGYYPARILLEHRYLAHAVKYRLGTQMLVNQLYKSYWQKWKTELECIHLLINHRSYLDEKSPIKNFDEINIKTYNYTYGYMVRDIIERANLVFT